MLNDHSIHLDVTDKTAVEVKKLYSVSRPFSLTTLNFGETRISVFGLRPEELSKLGYELTMQATNVVGTDR